MKVELLIIFLAQFQNTKYIYILCALENIAKVVRLGLLF